jgi:hypothetical protein
MRNSSIVFLACVLSACVTLVPGADRVRITRNAPDVTGCTPVGNIGAPRNADGTVDLANADRQVRNQTVGLGGNTALLVSPIGYDGVAYKCPQ